MKTTTNVTTALTEIATTDLNTAKFLHLQKLAETLGLCFGKYPTKPELIKILTAFANNPVKKFASELALQYPKCKITFKKPAVIVELVEPVPFGWESTDTPTTTVTTSNGVIIPIEPTTTTDEINARIIEICELANNDYKLNDENLDIVLNYCIDAYTAISTAAELPTMPFDENNGLMADIHNCITDAIKTIKIESGETVKMVIPAKPRKPRTSKIARTEKLVLFDNVQPGDIITYLHNTIPYLCVSRTDGGLNITSAGTGLTEYTGQRYNCKKFKPQMAFYLLHTENGKLPASYDNDTYQLLLMDAIENTNENGQFIKRKMNTLSA